MTASNFWEPYRISGKVYLPRLTAARWVKRFQVGEYHAMVGTDCESDGPIRYTHVMYVFKDGERQPCLAVSAEYSDNINPGNNRLLGLFFGGFHFTCGISPEWLDLEKFTQKAQELIVEPLGIPEKPREMPLPEVPSSLEHFTL